MNIPDAIRLARDVCDRRHLSIKTEKAYTHWLRRFGLFLKARSPLPSTPEAKIELFLTHLAARGASVSTQNQAFNAHLFFYREVMHRELGSINALRAKASVSLRDCPSLAEGRHKAECRT